MRDQVQFIQMGKKKQAGSQSPIKKNKKINKRVSSSSSSSSNSDQNRSLHYQNTTRRDKNITNAQILRREQNQAPQRIRETRTNRINVVDQHIIQDQTTERNNLPDCFQHFQNCRCQPKFSQQRFERNMKYAKNKRLTQYIVKNEFLKNCVRKIDSQPTMINIKKMIRELCSKFKFNGMINKIQIKIKPQIQQFLELFAMSLNITNLPYDKKTNEQKLATEFFKIILCAFVPQYDKVNRLINFVKQNQDQFLHVLAQKDYHSSIYKLRIYYINQIVKDNQK